MRKIAAALLMLPMLSAAPVHAQTGQFKMIDSQGRDLGWVTLRQEAAGLRLTLNLEKLPPGLHGMHLHQTGDCQAPDFKSAGGHFNPTGKHHGVANPEGHHLGDLPSIDVNESGRVIATLVAPDVQLTGGEHPLLDADGAALVIHADADDNRSDPAGNAGARIACGVISLKTH